MRAQSWSSRRTALALLLGSGAATLAYRFRWALVSRVRGQKTVADRLDSLGPGSRAHVLTYPILAASGTSGPKLRSGDRLVPEGAYKIESLNPNSLFHLSLRVNYPNEFDVARATAEGRTDLGGDIMIGLRADSL